MRILESVSIQEITAPFVLETHIDYHYSYIVLPYFEKETLLRVYMNANKKHYQISNRLKDYFWYESLKCVAELLVSSGLSHCDIKPDNIVIDFDNRLRFIDFGYAKIHNVPTSDQSGTPGYAAPEIYNRHV